VISRVIDNTAVTAKIPRLFVRRTGVWAAPYSETERSPHYFDAGYGAVDLSKPRLPDRSRRDMGRRCCRAFTKQLENHCQEPAAIGWKIMGRAKRIIRSLAAVILVTTAAVGWAACSPPSTGRSAAWRAMLCVGGLQAAHPTTETLAYFSLAT